MKSSDKILRPNTNFENIIRPIMYIIDKWKLLL